MSDASKEERAARLEAGRANRRAARSQWAGQRVTLGCGHIELYEADFGPQRIGQLTTCEQCPIRQRSLPETQMRITVNIELLELDEPPDRLPTGHLH